MFKFTFCRSLISVLSLSLLSSSLHAQQTSNRGESGGELKQLDEVVVVSTPLEQSLFESAQPVSVLSGDELRLQSRSTLGETLSNELGVSSSTFGAGSSRPVIRGLGGDRVRLLQNGLGSQDVSNTSPDHAVTIDPLLLNKIEVVRGPAALLYGTSAVGGVVNTLDGRIAEALPEGPFKLDSEFRGGTVDDERAMIGRVDVPVDSFVLHADGVLRNTHDYRIPGFARTEELRAEEELEFEEPRGNLTFSDTEARSGGLGASYIFDSGFIGVAASAFGSRYGVPNGENDISIDLDQERYESRGELRAPVAGIEKLRVNLGYVDYTHTEFEGEEIGTTFKNEGLDSRAEVYHDPIGSLKGLFGFQTQLSEFSAIGEEAFQPPTDTAILSPFVFEELSLSESVKLQIGARLDFTNYDSGQFPQLGEIERTSPVESLSRVFTTVSGSSGVVWSPDDVYSLGLSLSFTERAPAAQELFADGPHVATAAFEVGDPDLDTEKSLGIDITARKRVGRIAGSVGAFMNQFFDFISLDPTGEEEDGLQVFRFRNENAQFFGFESQIRYHLLGEVDESEPRTDDLAILLQPDWVWAENRDTGEAIPRIPPFRVRVGLEYFREEIAAQVNFIRAFEQGRAAEFETETDGFNLLNASVSYALKEQQLVPGNISLFLRGENLLNEKIRNSASFIKDVAPLPGANVIGGVRISF